MKAKAEPTAEIRVTPFDAQGGFSPLRGLAGVRVTLQGSDVSREAVTDDAAELMLVFTRTGR